MHYKKYNENKFVNYYLIIISLFSLLSILFFETTLGTQLSLTEVSNSFDRQLRFSQPLYLSGLLESFFNLESYLKIFTTSFFGVFILKIVLTLFNIEELNSFLGNLGLPVSNSDFQELLINLENISILKIFIVVVLIYLLVGYFYKNIKIMKKYNYILGTFLFLSFFIFLFICFRKWVYKKSKSKLVGIFVNTENDCINHKCTF